MTIEINQFKCPTCGHLIGEQEYKDACDEMNKTIQEASYKQIQFLEDEYKKQIEKIEEHHQHEIESKVNKIVISQSNKIELELQEKFANRSKALEEEFKLKMAEKDKEIEEAQSQNSTAVKEKIEQALINNEEKHRQREKQLELKIERVESQNKQMQNTLESIAPELRGTAFERVVLDDLRNGFRKDIFELKKVGKEMADIIQTIVTETGEKISTPIVYDTKKRDDVKANDIEKAKRYKAIHNTDCCIIVTAKGITAKDSESSSPGLIGKRDGILLVHPSVLIGFVRMMRNFMMENARITTTTNGRDSKQMKLYDYITSQTRFRKIQEKLAKNEELEDLQRREETHAKRIWNIRKKLIQDWFELDKDDEEIIHSMIQENQLSNDLPKMDEEDYYQSSSPL